MNQLKAIRETVNHIFWSLVLQGVLFVALAILVVIYPALLFALVAATFMTVGIGLLLLAWKVRRFWNRLPSFLK